MTQQDTSLLFGDGELTRIALLTRYTLELFGTMEINKPDTEKTLKVMLWGWRVRYEGYYKQRIERLSND